MPDTSELTEEEALSIIKSRSTAQETDDIDYDPNLSAPYAVDSDFEGYDEQETAVPTEEKGTTKTTAPVSEEAQALLAKLRSVEAENEKLRALEEKRKYEDFLKRRSELPPEEQAAFTDAYYRERERVLQMEAVRSRIEREYPLASALSAPILSSFDLEIEDPELFREIMERAESTYSELIKQMVDERVKAELNRLNAEKQKAWGFPGLGVAAPTGPSAMSPAAMAEQQLRSLQEQISKQRSLGVDDVQMLLRQRRKAKAQQSVT